jgi:sulfatase modifying factor 1
MIGRAIVAVLVLCIAGCRDVPSAPATSAANASPPAASHGAHQPASATASTDVAGAAAFIKSDPAPHSPPPGMTWVPGGRFWMGCENCGMPDALPLHLVSVDGFWMDRVPVTNDDFMRFVRATGYVTIAERPLDPKDYPGVPADKLVAGSAVFSPTSQPVPLDNPLRWWRYVPGARWTQPDGPGSGIADRGNHPVVHVAYDDAVAYARWAGKRLPTEAEFEFAARGGLDRAPYAWGHELTLQGKAAANVWQGRFPARDAGEDGFAGTSPVTAFPPNGFGLYDMGGNVWQWCADWYRPDTYRTRAGATSPVDNPKGPPDSFDPDEPGAAKRVQRGGSYLCTDQYCARYLVGSRGKGEVTSGASNLGFRLVSSATR